MISISPAVKFLMNLAKVQAVMNRRFDNGLGGLGFNEFIILYHLSLAEGEKMRRIDLAEKIGLTASGVTRLLLPMEKIGLVKKQVNRDDARVSLVLLAPGGRRMLTEGLERAEILSQEVIPAGQTKQVKELSHFLIDLGGSVK